MATKLTAEQLQELATMVANQLQANTGLTADEPTEDPVAPVEEPKSPVNPESPAFDYNILVDKLKGVLTEQSADQNNAVYETMFNEQYTQALASTPGLSEFMEGKDDYQRVRKEELEKITDYADRKQALTSLQTAFVEAQAGAPGRVPVVNKKAQELAKQAEDKYAELDKKLNDGEFKTEQEFAEASLELVSAEMARVQGQHV